MQQTQLCPCVGRHGGHWLAMTEQYVSHRLLDLLMIIVAASLAHWVRFGSLLMGEIYLFPLLFFAMFCYINLASAGVYQQALAVNISNPWQRVGQAIVLAGVFASTCLYLTKTAEIYSRIWFVLMVVFSAFLAISYRYVLKRITEKAVAAKKIVLLGNNKSAQKIVESASAADSKIEVCAVFADQPDADPKLQVNGSLSDSKQFIEDCRANNSADAAISEVWVSEDVYSLKSIAELEELLSDTAVNLVFVPLLPAHVSSTSAIEFVQGIPTIDSALSYTQRRKQVVKFLEDQLIAWPLLVLLAPLFAVVSLWIKIDSPGAVLFKQKRYGVAGQEFHIWKFRTMHVEPDSGDFKQTEANDPRVTRSGRLLRKWSIDELPQLLNVVNGSMSLVGPRPHASAHNEENRKLIDGYMLRHKIKPGITGLAQVRGFRGATHSVADMEKRVAADLEYVEEWDLALDIRILLLTVYIILARKNAY